MPPSAASPSPPAGTRLRAARQARGYSQHQLAGMAGITRQALSAVESGRSDPSLRAALAVARALGMTVEELFGPGDPAPAVAAAPTGDCGGSGSRVVLAPVGETFVALPLAADTAIRAGFLPAGGIVAEQGDNGPTGSVSPRVAVRPIGPPRPTLVVAGCDPALPLLETPLGLLDPPIGFAWWPCGSAEALRLAARGLVHAAGVHAAAARVRAASSSGAARRASRPPGAPDGQVIGFSAWREGLVLRSELVGTVTGLADVARHRLRLVNREPGAEARRLLDDEARRLGLRTGDLPGYGTRVGGHVQVAAAIHAGLADVGIASEPAALVYGLSFVPLAEERFDLVVPDVHRDSREVQGLLRALSSPWLLAQLDALPGYSADRCGHQVA